MWPFDRKKKQEAERQRLERERYERHASVERDIRQYQGAQQSSGGDYIVPLMAYHALSSGDSGGSSCDSGGSYDSGGSCGGGDGGGGGD